MTVPMLAQPTAETASPIRIAMFAATSWELGAVLAAFKGQPRRMVSGVSVFSSENGGSEFWVARSGVGPEKAARQAAWLLEQQRFQLVVSTGFACALNRARIGALVVGNAVMVMGTDKQRFIALPSRGSAGHDRLFSFARTVLPADRIGTVVSVERIVGGAAEKQHYASLTGAIALDMESGALASEAVKAEVPFVIVRAVSDLLDEELPLDFNLFLRPTGWLKGFASVIAAPSSLMGLGRLRRQSITAAKSLTRFFQQYLSAVMTSPNGTKSVL